MRRLLISATLVVLLWAVLMGAIELALALEGPFHPGDLLFPAQRFSERQYATWVPGDGAKTEYLLKLVDRRATDLARQAERPEEDLALSALRALNESLDMTLKNIGALPTSEFLSARVQLLAISERIESSLSLLRQSSDQASLEISKINAKLDRLSRTALDDKSMSRRLNRKGLSLLLLPSVMSGVSPGDSSLAADISPHSVYFPPGSLAAEHAFFPLAGGHVQLECEACHAEGVYSGTPNRCESCHAAVEPVSHFAGDCAACHSPVSWSAISFDHTLAGTDNCLSCHRGDKPANHFSGPCSACHTVSTWQPAGFNHQVAGASDCQSCHRSDRPAYHYNGQCSTCHNTNGWSGASFSHQGLTDCQSCHTDDRPANHYSGQCSDCHSTNGWGGASFSHQGLTDCQSCHADDRPANHFSGQCSDCHNTNGWGGASFSHQGLTDCQFCHADDRPASHYSGQCSACHSTSGWGGANFSHQGLTDCQSCHADDRPANHFGGQCSDCHSTNGWGGASFSHQGLTDCQSCHADDRPANHWQGQCSQCHRPDSWQTIQLANHTFPANHGSANGRCASCHTVPETSVNCYVCHDPARMEAKHAEEGIFDIAGRCLSCHPTGRED
jgi:hypothetical protein